MISAGYEPWWALFSASCAGLAALLHMMAIKHRGNVPASVAMLSDRDIESQDISDLVLVQGRLILQLDLLLKEAKKLQHSVGLMLVSFQAPEPSATITDVMSSVRRKLTKDSYQVFQVSGGALAVAQREQDVGTELAHVADALHADMRSVVATDESETVRMTVGVGLSPDADASAAELFSAARAAVRLAEEQKRDTFFRKI
jgi:hypothetical protein